jgi:hypothetical protein
VSQLFIAVESHTRGLSKQDLRHHSLIFMI